MRCALSINANKGQWQ